MTDATFDFHDGRGPVAARQHKNPDGSMGGWVDETATVGTDVYIGFRSSIGSGSSIGARCSIGDGSQINKDDWWITIGPQGSRNSFLTAVWSREYGLCWWVGCQYGLSTKALKAAVKETHGATDYADDYLAVIAFVENHPGMKRSIAAAKGAADVPPNPEEK